MRYLLNFSVQDRASTDRGVHVVRLLEEVYPPPGLELDVGEVAAGAGGGVVLEHVALGTQQTVPDIRMLGESELANHCAKPNPDARLK